MISQSGWTGLYRGLKPSLLGTTVSQGIYFYLYSLLRQAAVRHEQKQGRGKNGQHLTPPTVNNVTRWRHGHECLYVQLAWLWYQSATPEAQHISSQLVLSLTALEDVMSVMSHGTCLQATLVLASRWLSRSWLAAAMCC